MEKLQHDPLTKHQVKEALYEFLYTTVKRQQQDRLNTLIGRNTLVTGAAHHSFHYKGLLYSCDSTAPPKRWIKLVPQLRPLMDEYLKDVEQINRYEMPFVMGFINQVLNASNNFGDYFRLFPDCLHPPLKKLVSSCPCSAASLSETKVQDITQLNVVPINMIKQRMVINLLI